MVFTIIYTPSRPPTTNNTKLTKIMRTNNTTAILRTLILNKDEIIQEFAEKFVVDPVYNTIIAFTPYGDEEDNDGILSVYQGNERPFDDSLVILHKDETESDVYQEVSDYLYTVYESTLQNDEDRILAILVRAGIEETANNLSDDKDADDRECIAQTASEWFWSGYRTDYATKVIENLIEEYAIEKSKSDWEYFGITEEPDGYAIILPLPYGKPCLYREDYLTALKKMAEDTECEDRKCELEHFICTIENPELEDDNRL